MKRNFLVVSANAQVREALAGELRATGFSVTLAGSGKEADKVVRAVTVDAVIVESTLTDMTGDELCEAVKKVRPDCRTVVVTSFEQVRNTPEQLRFGSDDFLLRSSQVVNLLQSPYLAAGEGGGGGLEKRGADALLQVTDVLVGLLELDQRYFGGFSHQAMELARSVTEEMGGDEETVREVLIGALLRDIGKAGVDPEILTEGGRFSEEQRERMKAHVEGSLRLLEHIDFPWKVLPVIRHHHERYDGKGYPDGLSGRQIPMGARIISVVDAYAALTSGRSHRGAFNPEQALTMLISESGRQFDPEVVEAFQRVLDKRLTGRKTRRKPRVMVVDSQDDFRKLIKMRLLNEGYTVAEATDYGPAMGKMLKTPPDLLLVDLDADGAAAFQLLEEMRMDERLLRVPFAFLSRSSDRILKLRALRHGVDEFLGKDVDLDEIVARIGNVVTRESIRRDSAPRQVRRGITGDLENLSLPEIVQTLVMGMKTACVTLRVDGGEGQIWFVDGAVRHAKTPEQEGEQAFYEMVGWTRGEFVIEHGVKCKQTTVQNDAMFLLMEGLRKLDEAEAEAAQAVS